VSFEFLKFYTYNIFSEGARGGRDRADEGKKRVVRN
jgi:hypothetical protein